MGFFSRFTRTAQSGHAIADAHTARTRDALDTLASALRTLGRHAFELEPGEHETFRSACEGWARHVLTGAAIPDVCGAATSPEDRAWTQVCAFITERRKREQAFVQRNTSSFQSLVWELVERLRDIQADHDGYALEIDRSLRQLEGAACSSSPEVMREAIHKAVTTIQEAMDQQQRTFEHQLHHMGARLAEMRSDLIDTRRKMSLDPLTHVYNRGAFDGALLRYTELAQLSSQPVALIMLDLDRFKSINDTYGHPVGDTVLGCVANTIVRTFPRKNDFIARYGGEEFAAILFDVDRSDAQRMANALLDNIRRLEIELPDGGLLHITASAGCALLRPDDTPDTLLQRADQALYTAKHEGRDRICMDEPDPLNILSM
ncbi:MAG: GGDEF domain-containing protein, partial [Myxococcota bacterium]